MPFGSNGKDAGSARGVKTFTVADPDRVQLQKMTPKEDGAVQLKISGYDVQFPFKPYASQLVRAPRHAHRPNTRGQIETWSSTDVVVSVFFFFWHLFLFVKSSFPFPRIASTN